MKALPYHHEGQMGWLFAHICTQDDSNETLKQDSLRLDQMTFGKIEE